MRPLLDINDLSLSIHGEPLLQSITLSLAHGEKVALVGPNGAGKSSLLRTIAGLERSYLGSAQLDGHDLRNLPPRNLSRLVSMVPQRLPFLPRFTVAEFLDVTEARELANLDSTLKRLMHRYVPDLSGGELQRVILAGAVAQGTKLLLLDEPTAHLDPTGRSDVERVIAQYHEEAAMTYLLVTHDISLAVRAAERIIVMHAGHIVWDGASIDATLVSHLERAYSCRFAEVSRPGTAHRLIVPE